MKKLLLLPLIILLAYKPVTVVPYCGPFTPNAPITLNGASNVTLTGLSISCGTGNGIHLINCTNIHITKCRITNGTTANGMAIFATGCTNITVDSCAFENVTSGGQFQNCTTVKFNANEGHNMRGIQSTTPYYLRGQLVQFNNVNGAGSEIKNNKNFNEFNEFYDTSGLTSPEDHISLYKSNGTVGSHIIVSGNKLKGGGPSTTGSGITVGDNGGSYQDIINNILVQTGNVGMQVAGGTFITMSNNTVYSSGTVISHLGIGCGNFTPAFPMNNITISNNHVKWTSAKPADLAFYPPGTDSVRKDYSYATTGTFAVPQPTGWLTNVSDNSLTANILPNPLLTNCVLPLPPAITYTSGSFTFSYAANIGTLTPSNTGGPIVSCAVSPALPVGIALNASTCVITGTPTAYTVSASYTVTATNAAGGTPTVLTIAVNKVALTITAANKTKQQGAANPALAFTYSGLVNGDAGTATPPSISTTALTGSPAGVYPITPCCAADANYTISYVPGVLSVLSATSNRIYHRRLILKH